MTAIATAPRTATTTDLAFRANGKELKAALALVSKAVPRRSALPVLIGVRIEVSSEEVTLTTTNNDLTVSVTLPGGSGDGVAVLPARLLADIVRTAKGGDVELTCEDGKAHLRIGPAAYVVEQLPVEEFPAIPVAPKLHPLPEGFVEACKQVLPALSNDEARPILTAVCMESNRIMATDSYRLAIRHLPGLPFRDTILVPGSALALLRGDGLRAAVEARHLFVRDGSATIVVRLIEGEFPKVDRLFPKPQPPAVVERSEVLDAITAVRPVLGKYEPVGLELESSRVVAESDRGGASVPLSISYDGPPVTVHFSPRYFADGIKCCRTDKVAIEITNPLKPVKLSPVGTEGFVYLLMPVRPGR